jgi:hypothetical protein
MIIFFGLQVNAKLITLLPKQTQWRIYGRGRVLPEFIEEGALAFVPPTDVLIE